MGRKTIGWITDWSGLAIVPAREGPEHWATLRLTPGPDLWRRETNTVTSSLISSPSENILIIRSCLLIFLFYNIRPKQIFFNSFDYLVFDIVDIRNREY